MRPLSQDLRQRIIAARERGAGAGEVCKRFGVSRKSVERFWKPYSLTGVCLPKQIGGYRRSRLEPHDRILRRWIEGKPDLPLGELQKRCLEPLNVAIGLIYKKNESRRRARAAGCQGRPEALAQTPVRLGCPAAGVY